MFVVMFIAMLYFIVPIWWFIVASTKSNADLFSSFPFWFKNPQFFTNLDDTIQRQDGIFFIWTRNSLLYSGVGATICTAISTMAGYALAKYKFKGQQIVFNCVLGATLVPMMLLTVPLYLLFAKIGIIDTIWAVIIPLLINPFGIYLCRIYAGTIPDELLEAGRIDGANEWLIFLRIGVKIMSPALITVFLIQFVGTWANYFLPMMMVSTTTLQPLSVGIVNWQETQVTGAAVPTNIVIFAAFISVLPLIALFLLLQRYWREGLTAGSVKT
ncbi:MAG: carbohydrate ABC transporter permease [Actinomycetaceae bacterium]|nr:carbohydrate ABC transporter permease [Actinomycetaceae bacterium]